MMELGGNLITADDRTGPHSTDHVSSSSFFCFVFLEGT